MAKFPTFLKNKYIITIFIFICYILFLDDTDIFTMLNNYSTRSKIRIQNEKMQTKLTLTNKTLIQLQDFNYLETYARSNKFFKHDTEDIFIINYE